MMKKIFLLLSVMLTMALTQVSYAETSVFEYDFTGDDRAEVLAGIFSSDAWEIYNSNRVNIEGRILSIGHSNHEDPVGLKRVQSDVGLKYSFEITTKSHGNRYIDEENLTDGEYWTTRTVIGNGSYRLDFSIECGGIYGYNKDNKWTKLYDGECYTDTGEAALYSVEVEGSKAKISRAGTFLLEYEMPADKNTDYFELTSKSKQYADNAIFHVSNMKLSDQSDLIEYKYTGITSNGIEFADIIGANSDSLVLCFNYSLPNATVYAQLNENGEEIDVTVTLDGDKITVTPGSGFSYGADYVLTVSISGIRVSDLPERFEFSTYEDNYKIDAVINSEDIAAVSADVVVANYSGHKSSAAVIIAAYADGVMFKWDYVDYGEIEYLASAADLKTPEIDATGAEKISVMVVDSLENIIPLSAQTIVEVE